MPLASQLGRMAAVRVDKREIFGWAMFDFANSSYTTVIVTVVYAVVFPKVIVGDAPEFRRGNLLFSLSLAATYLLVVVSAPLLGALMDFRAAKKRFLFGSYLGTILATLALGLAGPGDIALAMGLLVLSNFGFSIGESFVASFLPELGDKESLGRISGLAWGLGYIGGLMSTMGVLVAVGPLELENASRLRLVGPLTALFFGVAAIPTFLFLKERGTPRALPAGKSLAAVAFAQVARTARALPRLRDLSLFMVSLFFAMAGLGIVISFAFIYGDQVVRWRASIQVAMFVLTNLSAAVGALLFGLVQDRWGNMKTYRLTLIVWCVAVLGIYETRRLSSLTGLSAEYVYLVVGALAGLCLGATQSAGRTVVAVLSPPDNTAEMFGFWGMVGKLAAAVGLVGLGLLQSAFGLENAILLCALLFGAAYLAASRVDEQRGAAQALG
ncbi:MAG: MFS transporter [Polyangiaceae bacterium]